MAFQMFCSNKGCYKQNTPTLDLKDNEAYCGECGNVIANVSHFTKTQMKSLGQTRKPVKGAFSIRCEKCKQECMPKVGAANLLVCGWCSSPHKTITKPFEMLIRAAILKGNEEL